MKRKLKNTGVDNFYSFHNSSGQTNEESFIEMDEKVKKGLLVENTKENFFLKIIKKAKYENNT